MSPSTRRADGGAQTGSADGTASLRRLASPRGDRDTRRCGSARGSADRATLTGARRMSHPRAAPMKAKCSGAMVK